MEEILIQLLVDDGAFQLVMATQLSLVDPVVLPFSICLQLNWHIVNVSVPSLLIHRFWHKFVYSSLQESPFSFHLP